MAAGVVMLGAVFCRRPVALPVSHQEEVHPAEARTLTVAFWNLEWFPGRHPHAGPGPQEAHVAAVLPVVERIAPDVFGLEEIADRDAAATVAACLPGFKVDVCSEFLRGPEQKRKRAPRRGKEKDNADNDEPTPDDTPPPTPADYNAPWIFPDRQQIALCSRLPVLATGAEPWKNDAAGRRQRRGFVWAAYRTAPGEAVLVYALHLKSNVVDEPGGQPANVLLREEASRQLLAHARANAAAWARTDRLRLMIVGGDMNNSLDDPAFARETTLRDWLGAGGFRWGWEGVPLPRRLTLPAKGHYPATCFDHVFYQPGDGSVRLVSTALENSTPASSDHRPVVARFGW